jgi:hypothetical protein
MARPVLLRSLFALLIFAASACSAPGRYDSGVPDSVLVVVLADLHLLEAALQMEASEDSLFLDDDSLASTLPGTRDSVLASHGLTEDVFNRAMEPYLQDPTQYVYLYNRVLDNLIQRGRSDLSRAE